MDSMAAHAMGCFGFRLRAPAQNVREGVRQYMEIDQKCYILEIRYSNRFINNHYLGQCRIEIQVICFNLHFSSFRTVKNTTFVTFANRLTVNFLNIRTPKNLL